MAIRIILYHLLAAFYLLLYCPHVGSPSVDPNSSSRDPSAVVPSEGSSMISNSSSMATSSSISSQSSSMTSYPGSLSGSLISHDMSIESASSSLLPMIVEDGQSDVSILKRIAIRNNPEEVCRHVQEIYEFSSASIHYIYKDLSMIWCPFDVFQIYIYIVLYQSLHFHKENVLLFIFKWNIYVKFNDANAPIHAYIY